MDTTTKWEWRGTPVWWVRVRSLLLLVAVGFAVATSRPHADWHGPGLRTTLGLAVLAGWLLFTFNGPDTRDTKAGVVLAGAAGLFLCFTNPASAAAAYPCIVCVNAGARTPPRWSVGLAAGLALAYDGAVWVLHGSLHWSMLVVPAGFGFGLLVGLFRRQNAALQRQTEHAREEQARSAALAERARIAREIHDVLAHSLSALSVQLETADALLEGDHPDRARTTLGRARQLTREGLAETRRAVAALHGDAVPLPQALTSLAEAYTADTGCPASSTVQGQPRQLSADAGLAVYRTAQEALTNARKHASGAAVTLRLAYHPEEVALTVTDTGGEPPRQPAPDDATAPAGGYGLTGLRERAELAGGMFHAGPCGDGWRVDVKIPE
jgi:signal transduction histidine kinase